MKTHKLFLLALTALCSLGVWGETVTVEWGHGKDNSLPANSSSESDGITLSSDIPFDGEYDGNIGYSDYYDFKGADVLSTRSVIIKADENVTISKIEITGRATWGNGDLVVEFYSDVNLSSVSKTETMSMPNNLSANTSRSMDASDGAKAIKIYRPSSYWHGRPLLLSVSVTAESAAPAGPTHQVIYAAGGAQGTVPATKEVEETKNYKLAQPSNLTYDGHFFAGWKTEGDETIYPAGTQMTMGTADVTYTAQWEIDYTATWGHFHSATPLRPFPSAASDELNKIKITTNLATTTSNCQIASDVCGWGVSGISAYACSATSHTLDIQVANEYNIEKIEASTSWYTMKIQYASSATFDAAYALGDPITLPHNSQDQPQIIGAINAPDGARSARITPIDNTSDWKVLYYLKVYAKLAPYFDVTYNAGGATGTAPADDKAYEGTPYTLAEPTELEKTGFVFTGWKSSIDEEVYAAGTSLEITDDVEFTAQWEVELVDPTITFSPATYIVDETTLDLSSLFESNSTGAVTYTIKDAGTTGAAISGTTFTATATGTAIVTASQARVEGAYNAKSVETTITVRAYAKTANFLEEANKKSGQQSVATFLSQNHYSLTCTTAYWDPQTGDDGGLAWNDVQTLSFLVAANSSVSISVGNLQGYVEGAKASLIMYDENGTQIDSDDILTQSKNKVYTTDQVTKFAITTPQPTDWQNWNRMHLITITDMSPKTVSFDTHGGTPATIEPITEESFGDGITLPDAPTKTGFIFDGWYTAATGGILAGNAGETYYPADNCTLHAHWVGYAKTVDFMDAAKRQTPQPTVADFLAANNYTMSPLRDAKWDDNNYGAPDAGLKVEDSDRDFSFWVAAGKQVTIQLGTWQGNYEGANKPELYANGEKLLDLKTSQQANDPIIVTEDTKFVIKIVNPWWSSIQIITIEDAPLPEITISDQAEDNSVLVANEGKTVNVQLERSLTGGMFNTICLPFSLSADQIATSDLAGAQIVQLVSTSLENKKLYLEYDEVEAIEAGKGYLIAPVADVTDPSFEAVTISKTEATIENIGAVTVNPTFIISEIPANPANLYLYLDNTLYYPNNDLQIDGLRLYYHVNGEANLMPARMRMVGRGTPTDINIFPYEGKTEIGSAKFIHQGHLYILKGGKLYNAQGQIAK